MNTSLTGRVEGAGSSELPTGWWTSHPLRAVPTGPSPHVRRVATVVASIASAAIAAAASRLSIYHLSI